MCVVSFVGDHFRDRWFPQPTIETSTTSTVFPFVTQAQLAALREEMLEAIEALRAAVLIDRVTGQADCEMEEKLEVLRRVAEAVGLGDALEEVLAGG